MPFGIRNAAAEVALVSVDLLDVAFELEKQFGVRLEMDGLFAERKATVNDCAAGRLCGEIVSPVVYYSAVFSLSNPFEYYRVLTYRSRHATAKLGK